MSDDPIVSGVDDSDFFGAIRVDLGKLLADAGMTQAELGEAIGIHPNNVNRLVNGHLSAIRLTVLARICRVLKCNVGDVLTYVGPAQIEEHSTIDFVVPDTLEGMDYAKLSFLFVPATVEKLEAVETAGEITRTDFINQAVQVYGTVKPYLDQDFEMTLVKEDDRVGMDLHIPAADIGPASDDQRTFHVNYTAKAVVQIERVRKDGRTSDVDFVNQAIQVYAVMRPYLVKGYQIHLAKGDKIVVVHVKGESL